MNERDPRPTRRDLAEVGREVLPPHGGGRTGRHVAADAVLRLVAFGIAAVVLPDVRFLGDGRPPPGDVLQAAGLIAVVGALYAPMWRWLAGPMRGLAFGATAVVLDLALLRVADAVLGSRLEIIGVAPLLAAAVVVAIPTAVSAVVVDLLSNPDRMSLPD